jgi:hypothetical protein
MKMNKRIVSRSSFLLIYVFICKWDFFTEMLKSILQHHGGNISNNLTNSKVSFFGYYNKFWNLSLLISFLKSSFLHQ